MSHDPGRTSPWWPAADPGVIMDAADAASPLVLYFLAGVAGVPFWLWLARRTSKHRAWCWG